MWMDSILIITKLKGFPIATIVNGAIVMENGNIISKQIGEPISFEL